MSAKVRPARTDDAGAIGRIHVLSWQSAYDGILPARYLDELSISEHTVRWHARLRHTQPGLRIWVIEDDGTVAGFAETGPTRDKDVLPGTAELYVIYLDPDSWGRGLGRLLMKQAVADVRARGYRFLIVWVLDGNRRARRFYEACGMKPDGGTKVELHRSAVAVFEVRYRLDLYP